MVRVGIGGWDYEPWRGTFFPQGLPKSRQLEFASRALTAIEVNGTFYRTQTPTTFRRWAEETPDGFVFTLKAPRYVVNRTVLAEAGPGISRFLESGIAELGAKLGAILWQLAPTKRFDADDVAAFFAMLPPEVGGVPLHHAIEVRNESFNDVRFVDLARRHQVSIVYADTDGVPAIADQTGGLFYVRLRRCVDSEALGYPPAALDAWADRARLWESGTPPPDLPLLTAAAETPSAKLRTVFMFFISGAKVRAPAAAQALIERLRE